MMSKAVFPVVAFGACLVIAGSALAAGQWVEDRISGCAIWSTDEVGEREGVSWSGACTDGKASGHGVLVWWDQNGLQGRFFGTMAEGKLNGEGRLFMRDDEAEGFNEYLGRFADSQPVGKGFLTTAAGEHFYGELLDGLRHGKGVLVTSEGWTLKGEFEDGAPVGTLVVDYTTEDGERYLGQAENAERHGFGILTTANKDFYAGGFAEGEPDGQGIYEGQAGNRYAGDYENGEPNGFGTWIDKDGYVVQGRFVDGEPTGTVLITEPDGTQTVTELETESMQ